MNEDREYYFKICNKIADRSNCRNIKESVIVVDEDTIICSSYNSCINEDRSNHDYCNHSTCRFNYSAFGDTLVKLKLDPTVKLSKCRVYLFAKDKNNNVINYPKFEVHRNLLQRLGFYSWNIFGSSDKDNVDKDTVYNLNLPLNSVTFTVSDKDNEDFIKSKQYIKADEGINNITEDVKPENYNKSNRKKEDKPRTKYNYQLNTKICPNCGETFQGKHNRKYCNHPKIAICEVCKNVFQYKCNGKPKPHTCGKPECVKKFRQKMLDKNSKR